MSYFKPRFNDEKKKKKRQCFVQLAKAFSKLLICDYKVSWYQATEQNVTAELRMVESACALLANTLTP